jgi:epoxyqueuosine reductase QueG
MMAQLSNDIFEYLMSQGVSKAGIATLKTLKGGPLSADISYAFPDARSAITFAIPLDQDLIRAFLMKKDRVSHERDNLRTTALASGLSLQLAKFLEQQGFPSVPVSANFVYRDDVQGIEMGSMIPDLSHRYLAVRSGVGHFGFSGNVITQKNGAAVILGTTLTAAELAPTDPLPEEENYCDDCRLCVASCASGFMDGQEMERVTLGGIDFTYSKRRDYARCEFVCGGFTGLHPSGKWSTWSPARFKIPENDEEFAPVMAQAYEAYTKRPQSEGGFRFFSIEEKLYLTCGNCQLVCHPDREERKRRHRMLVESGVVIQNSDGSLKAVSPDKARDILTSMAPELRAVYEGAKE